MISFKNILYTGLTNLRGATEIQRGRILTGIVDTIFGEFEMKYASTAVGNICEETRSLIGLVLGEYS